MKKVSLITAFLCLILISSIAQTRTVGANGNWDNTGTWQSGNIADLVSEDVDFAAGEKTATVQSGFNYTVGAVAFDDDGNLQIEGTLAIGNASNARNLTAVDGSVSASGTLTIWGNVVVTNGLSWIVSGTVVIKGNLVMGNGASITNSGNFTVDGNFTAGQNTAVINSSNINVGGAVTVSTGSTLTNSGTFNANSCSGPPAFCGGVLPVDLIYFKALHADTKNILQWATSMETGFDRFVIQRSLDGINYHDIGEVPGAGINVYDIEKNYSFTDDNPMSGKNYYRLKSVDLDGYFEYSDVILANSKASKNVTVFPNPSGGKSFNFLTNFKPSTDDLILIFDHLGVRVNEFSVSDFEGSIIFSNDLIPGTYFMQYSSSQFTQVIRFTVK